jgi:hypothetical protein
MKSGQLIKYVLPSPTWAAGSNAVVTMRDIPYTLFGRIAHLVGINIEARCTPTLTTAPTLVGMHTIINRLEFSDGIGNRFTGDFFTLRVKEILENGRLLQPDPDTGTGSGNVFTFSRYLSLGPSQFAGNPSDFAYPVAALNNGELRLGFGALTSFSADTTVMTVSLTVTADILLLDEVRVPPAYEFTKYTAGGPDISLTGRALYAFLALLDSSSYGAFTAGDLGNITVDTGAGQVVPSINAAVLTESYRAQMASGHFTPVQGDPRTADDDSAKIVNSGTPTALTVASAAIQPVLWCPPDCQLTKVVALADSNLRVRWDGSQTSSGTVLVAGRIMEQTPTQAATIAAKAVQNLGLTQKSGKVKTLSKDAYSGPRPEFMPWVVKVG